MESYGKLQKSYGKLQKSYGRLREVTKGTMRLLRRRPAYEKLKFYQEICEIRRRIYQTTERLVKSHVRLVSQMRDVARSAKQNIQEGYRKGTIGDFIRSLKIAQGSLEELAGDIEDCREDGLMKEEEFTEFSKLFQSADSGTLS